MKKLENKVIERLQYLNKLIIENHLKGKCVSELLGKTLELEFVLDILENDEQEKEFYM